MSETLKPAEDLMKTLLELSPELLIVLALVGLAHILRAVPSFPNKWINLTVVLAAPVFYLAMVKGDPGKVPANIRNPEVYQAALGLILGLMAWLINDKMLTLVEKYIATKFPTFGKLLGVTSDTEMIRKEAEKVAAQLKEEKKTETKK